MSLCALTTFDKHCPGAAGGLRSIKLYLSEDVTVRPQYGYTHYSTAEPTLADGKSAYELPIDNFSGSISIRPLVGAGGDYYQHRVRCRFRRNRKEVGAWRRLLQNRKVHLLTEDHYGVRMWFEDLRLLSDLEHGERISSTNQFTFIFQRAWQHPGVYLSEIIDPSNLPTIWGDDDANEQWGEVGGDVWGFPGS